MSRRRGFVGRWLPAVAVAALAGCAPSVPGPQGALPAPSYATREGARLFVSYCAPCHGEEGRGDGAYLSEAAPAAPPDFTAPGAAEGLGVESVARRLAVSEALSERHCPPWGATLSPGEVEALAAYVSTLAREAGDPPAGEP